MRYLGRVLGEAYHGHVSLIRYINGQQPVWGCIVIMDILHNYFGE